MAARSAINLHISSKKSRETALSLRGRSERRDTLPVSAEQTEKELQESAPMGQLSESFGGLQRSVGDQISL